MKNSFNLTTKNISSQTLKIFSLTQHQNSSFSRSIIPNPDANSIQKSTPPNFQSQFPTKPNHDINKAPLHTQNQYHDIVSSNKMITSYIRAGDFPSALQVFDQMSVKTTVSWNSILSGFCKKFRNLVEAERMFDRIPEPDTVSYNIMLACYIHNSCIDMAYSFFDRMPIKDIASWNTMISGFAQIGKMDEARKLFSIMSVKNSVSWNAMITGYIEYGNLGYAEELFRVAPVKSVVAWTALITGYMKFGNVDKAETVFEEMPMKNLVSWNAMIAGYVENGRPEDGMNLFKKMIEGKRTPNPSSLCSVLLSCSNLSALLLGKQVHQLVYKFRLVDDTKVGTSLISMYGKCGDLADALKIFHDIPQRDIVTWNAMISGYAQHGLGDKALFLFEKMQETGTKPDWITFVAILSACNHGGLVDLGVHYFDSMTKDYGVEAKPDHYTCMIDLLGRAGKLLEAVNLIKSMPFSPHSAIYGTLLGACRIHKNVELAEFAAKNLLCLDRTNAAAYVQLANVYASAKRWDMVSKVRRLMKDDNVIKTPGYSWIEIKNMVHEFRSGDSIHPELDLIQKKLMELEEKMKVLGYVANLEFALHDVGEDQKEQLLWKHSEKLAIALGLLKMPIETTICVFKNLRVCGDCHSAIKYMSAIEAREIVVRDTVRFHHFSDGVCSCGDYW